MYETPKLERYGSFRELTLGGGATLIDPYGPNANGPGCVGDLGDPVVCSPS